MRSEIVFSDRQLRSNCNLVLTWCQLGANLFNWPLEGRSHPRIGHLDYRFRHSMFLTRIQSYRPASVPSDASSTRGVKSLPVIGS